MNPAFIAERTVTVTHSTSTPWSCSAHVRGTGTQRRRTAPCQRHRPSVPWRVGETRWRQARRPGRAALGAQLGPRPLVSPGSPGRSAGDGRTWRATLPACRLKPEPPRQLTSKAQGRGLPWAQVGVGAGHLPEIQVVMGVGPPPEAQVGMWKAPHAWGRGLHLGLRWVL